MLTLFTIPKPFRGHIDVTQRNTLRTWKLLHPEVEVIVFGEEEGAADVCRELDLRYEPEIVRNEFGTPFLDHAFEQAQLIARHDWLCYSNCDIALMSDFLRAFQTLRAWRERFMMVGRRWDTDITEPLAFNKADWERSLRETALQRGKQRGPDWIDYFAFRKGACAGLPPFVVGRPCWDHWLVWWMRHSGVPVVDVSGAVVAVHQNHDYSYHPQGEKGAREGPEFKGNRALVGSWRHMNTIDDASHILDGTTVRRTYRHWETQFRRERTSLRNRLLVSTGPVRHRLGLRRSRPAMLSKPD